MPEENDKPEKLIAHSYIRKGGMTSEERVDEILEGQTEKHFLLETGWSGNPYFVCFQDPVKGPSLVLIPEVRIRNLTVERLLNSGTKIIKREEADPVLLQMIEAVKDTAVVMSGGPSGCRVVYPYGPGEGKLARSAKSVKGTGIPVYKWLKMSKEQREEALRKVKEKGNE
jgi:hypothetical protein